MNKVIWCNRGWFPVYYGFCPTEAAWRRELKRMEVENRPPYPTKDGQCSFFTGSNGGVCAIVTIGDHIDEQDYTIGIVGLIVHEATHVWQEVRENIGEQRPSREFEAYAIQFISQELIDAYHKTRWPKRGRRA